MGSKQRLKDSVRRLLPLPLGRASLHSVLDMEHHPLLWLPGNPKVTPAPILLPLSTGTYLHFGFEMIAHFVASYFKAL